MNIAVPGWRWTLLVISALVVTGCNDDNGSSGGTVGGGGTAANRSWVVPDAAAPLTPDQRTAFADGNLYLNAHTEANPNGEIRGQLDRSGTTRFASLDGAQETPSTTTGAVGAGVLTVDLTTGKLSGFVVTTGLHDVTAAHVHLAPRGTPGDVIVPLAGGPDAWVVPDAAAPLTPAQVAAFLAGGLYFNVHTAANPNGEIRGQLDKGGTPRLTALDGAQETPPVTTSAFGAGVLAVDDGGQVSGFLATSGLVDSTVAHVHQAARGTPGPVIVPLVGGPGLWVVPDGATALSDEQRSAFDSGSLYFNAHTNAHPDGEIRGQLDKSGPVRVTALDGAQETPPVTTEAFGAGMVSVAGGGEVAGFLLGYKLVSPTVAHIHQAARGTPGPVIVPLGP